MDDEERTHEPRKHPRRRRRKKLLRWLLGTVLAAAALLAGLLVWKALTWPQVARLATENPQSTAFIDAYRRRAEATGAPPPQWRWVPYNAISDQLKQAVVVAEDIDFFSHDGFAPGEIRAALRATLEEGKPLRGASTLTQQLAKNLWLSPSRNPLRKLEEALLTMQLERHLGKHRILELYLNVVELGPGIYGAEAAARHYFGKPAAALTAGEAAALAASLPRPSSWHPGSSSRGYQRYRARIEGRMAKARWVMKEL
jgi:monofunctional biosynthetic peptidoglycan transglycosylase